MQQQQKKTLSRDAIGVLSSCWLVDSTVIGVQGYLSVGGPRIGHRSWRRSRRKEEVFDVWTWPSATQSRNLGVFQFEKYDDDDGRRTSDLGRRR